MWCVPHQYGSRNVVACIGSAITEKHIRQIKKLTRRVTLALDPDAAGESATVRGIAVAQEAFDRVAGAGAGPGPRRVRRREARRAEGHRALRGAGGRGDHRRAAARRTRTPTSSCGAIRRAGQRAVEEAQPLIDFLIDAQTADLALETPQGKMEACKRLLPIIAEVRYRTLAGEYADRLAMKVRLDVNDVQRDLAQARQRLDREARTPPTRRGDDDRSLPDQTRNLERYRRKVLPWGLHGPSYSATDRRWAPRASGEALRAAQEE